MEDVINLNKVKYLIIGAGVSGLSFANFIKSDSYLIIEKEKEAGGYCRTIYEQDFVWDYAGHFFHFATPKLKNFFSNKINQSEIIYKKKNTKIFYNGEYIDYPFQKNIHQLNKSEFIDCLYDLFNKEEKEHYNSFEEMLYGKFGKSITEKFLKPYNEKLYACNLNSLDSDAMGRFFPYANKEEIINNMKIETDNSYNHEFFYAKKGAKTFINALLEDLDKSKILYDIEVQRINLQGRYVETPIGAIEYEFLINTMPLDLLIKTVSINEYNKYYERLSYNKVLVFNLGFDKKSSISNLHWIYVPDKNINFYRVGFYDNILDTSKLSMYIEIGFNSNDKINIEREMNETLINLKRLGIIDDHKLIASTYIIMNPAYVHISNQSQDIKNLIKGQYQRFGVYTIGRYGDWKYCSIEDSILDAINLSKMLNEL